MTDPSRLRPCPECRAGKHGNCDGVTWDDVTDSPAKCPCTHEPVDEARRGRYHAALATARLDAVLRIADEEQAELRAELDRLRDVARGLHHVWSTVQPSGLMSRRRAAEVLADTFTLPEPSRSTP